MKIDFEFLIFDSTLIIACPPAREPKTEPQVKNIRIYSSRSKKPNESGLWMFIQPPFSCKKCFLFLLIIIGILILISVFFSLIIIFVLKPRRPVFLFQSMNIASYKFDVSGSSSLFVSLVASVTLIAQNPNRIGINYDSSRLQILEDGFVIGLIRIPEFYQSPRSHNVSVDIDLVFQCLDVTSIMSGFDTTNFSIKVFGDIGVRLKVLQVKLPKIKVGLDCDVAVDDRYLISEDEISSLKAVKNHIAHFDANSQAFSKKCSI
ncbi:LOW QUALITY PROTEIN: hypothetical protein OSB04_004481, partial [Centaurea solstitialis]